jgi:hypothetical protein
MEALPEIASVIGSEIDSTNGSVSITFESTEKSQHTIKIKNVAIGQFLAGLANKPLNKQGQASLHYIIPLRPQGLRPFYLPNGEYGVEFQIADRIGLPIVIPEEGVPALASAAAALESLAAKSNTQETK